MDDKIKSIIERSGADSCEVFLTGHGNFRVPLATIAPYKGTRQGVKPYHWETVSRRLIEEWGAKEYCGIEADDAIATRATELFPEVITASRDKDLRQVPGYHYSWACGESQPEKPTYLVDYLGKIHYEKDKWGGYKLHGHGLRFFYAQLLVGDSVDNIKGCPKVGALKAVTTLGHLISEKDLFEACEYLYRGVYGDDWEGKLVENARLLYLIRDRSWVEEEPQDNHEIKCYIKKLWERPNANSGDDLSATQDEDR